MKVALTPSQAHALCYVAHYGIVPKASLDSRPARHLVKRGLLKVAETTLGPRQVPALTITTEGAELADLSAVQNTAAKLFLRR